MKALKPTLIFVGSLVALLFCTICHCADSLATEKNGYLKLLPKLDPAAMERTPVKTLKGQIGQSVTMDTRSVGNPWGYAPFGSRGPQIVLQVVPRSPASRGGLQVGDRILGAMFRGNMAQLIVGRGGQRYRCLMSLNDLRVAPSAKPLTGSATATDLTDHDIVLLVDSSASMNTKDCPGGVSRWDWCRNQAATLYSGGKEISKNKISITTFNSQLNSHSNCRLEDLTQVFQKNIPAGETDMTPAIVDAMATVSSHIFSGKPAVIAVVTDGRPTDVDALKSKIIHIANDLRDPSLLTIAFIEIGTPERYLRELDNDLVKQGAKADIVVVFPFSAVNNQGLADTLAKAVRSHAESSKPIIPPPPPRIVNTSVVDSDDENSTAVKPPPPPAKPTTAQSEQQRLEKEKRDAEDSKLRRSAANSSYDFSRPKPGATIRPPVRVSIPAAAKASTVAPPVEVDEQESVRRQESNRTYGNQ